MKTNFVYMFCEGGERGGGGGWEVSRAFASHSAETSERRMICSQRLLSFFIQIICRELFRVVHLTGYVARR